jgi:hypothetical protein
MQTLDDLEALCMALPDVREGTRFGNRTWFVQKHGFAWERPLTKADIARLGDEPVPRGPIVALAVSDLGEKQAVLEANPTAFFSIAHFEGYPAILVKMNLVTRRALVEAVLDAWLARAPRALADAYLGTKGGPRA